MLRAFLRAAALAVAVLGTPALAQTAASDATPPTPPPPAPTIDIRIAAQAQNPATPRMGDRIGFASTITNTGQAPINGLVAWVSLVRVDPGNEQPVDLEDWSAHKAEVFSSLDAGQSVQATWPFRLIQAGTYRVVVSSASREAPRLVASNMLTFTVAPKPVVESRRVLPIAVGTPLLLIAALLYRRRRGAAV